MGFPVVSFVNDAWIVVICMTCCDNLMVSHGAKPNYPLTDRYTTALSRTRDGRDSFDPI